MRTRLLSLFMLVVASSLLVGCGGSTVPVSGTVKLKNGTPLKAGEIEFTKEGEGLAAVGQIDESGKFSLHTYGDNDGAPVGKYTVTIINADPTINEVYLQHGTTPLKYEVPSGGATFDIEVEQ